jgi:NAD(P) transhydrogenase subunit alpha
MEQLATHRIIDVPPRRPVDAVMAARRAESFGKRSIKSTSKDAALRMAVAMTDLTTLEGKDSPERVRALCRKAIAPAPHLDAELRAAGRAPVPSVAAVCVYPNLVAVARDALEGSGGYAREMSDDRAQRQRDLLAPHIAEADVVITTAAVPGRQAPLLVTRSMVEGMKPGSVVVDLAATK